MIVVGAGVTGLTAAWRLAAGRRRRARARGARPRRRTPAQRDAATSALFEIGGQWIAPDQTALRELVEELGPAHLPAHREGDSLFLDRVRHRAPLHGRPTSRCPADTAAEVERLTKTLDALAGEMDPERPWELADARHLDSVTFSAWLEAQTDDPQAAETVALYVGPAMLTKPAHAFSALQAVLMAASAGSFSNLVDADVILDRRVDGGLAQVPLRAGRAPRRPGAPRAGRRARPRGPTTASRCSVGGEVHTARRLVLALPPTHVRRIRFTPDLPAEHRAAREHTVVRPGHQGAGALRDAVLARRRA